MKTLSVLIGGLLAVAGAAQGHDLLVSEQARSIAKHSIVIDTHIDVPYRLEEKYDDVSQATSAGDFDYPRALAGGLDAPFMSIYIPAEFEKKGGGLALADQLIDRVEAVVGRAPEKFALAYTVADIKRNFKDGKISLPMGMENGTPVEGSFENLQHLYDRGIRYITLAHSKSNHISDSSYSEVKPWQGLSPFGKKLVKQMNNIGMMVDISHVSDQAFYHAVEVSAVPVIASHSSLRHFTPGWERNMDDKMLKALQKNGGVIQINYGSAFIHVGANNYNKDKKKAVAAFKASTHHAAAEHLKAFEAEYKASHPYPYASLSQVLDHFDRAIKLIGIDHVGIGSDFDGVGNTLPEHLKDVASYPNLVQGLLNRGYKSEDIQKILGGNLLRVWQQVEDYAAKH